MHAIRRFLAALSLSLPLALLAAPQARVIVAFKPDAAVLHGEVQALAAESAARRSVRLQRRADALAAQAGRPLLAGRAVAEHWQVMRADGVDSQALATRLAAHPDVAWAVPDRRRHALAAPNDPLYPAVMPGLRPLGPDAGQWYLRPPDTSVRSAANAEAAWDRSTGSGIVIAILDTGVRPEHPDLQGRLLAGIDTIDDVTTANDGNGADGDASDPGDWVTAAESASGPLKGCDAGDSSWHGTQVATIAGARSNDNDGMAGTAPGAMILPVRVLGKCGGYDSDIIAGMLWAAGLETVAGIRNQHPARVLNLSLGGPHDASDANECSPYDAAIARINAVGAVLVVAAGNGVGGPVGVPARCQGAIAVAGLRHVGTKVGFSDIGPQVAFSAPGGNCVNLNGACLYPILAGINNGLRQPAQSTWTDSYNYGVGTSFSAPIASGAAALVLSHRPALAPLEVKAVLQSTARQFPTSGATNGAGELPVRRCDEPNRLGSDPDGSDSQCYCTVGLCGTGMLDAAAAVVGSAGAFARIVPSSATAQAGTDLIFDGASSLVAVGRTLAAYQWRVSDGGGIVSGLVSASNAPQATLRPSAAGSFTLELTVTDDQGATAVTQTTVAVSASAGGGGASGGGGGGVAHPGWLLGLLAAAAALRLRDRG